VRCIGFAVGLFLAVLSWPLVAKPQPVDPVAPIMEQIRIGKPAEAVKLADALIATIGPKEGAGTASTPYCAHRGDTLGSALGAAARKENATFYPMALCDAHFLKAFALIDMGRGDLAESELQQAIALDPLEAHYVNEYAELYKSRREWQKSYDLFARAWGIVDKGRRGPDATIAARALRGMGYNKIEMMQFGEAETLFRQSQDYEPDSEVARSELQYIARKKAIGS
jgi:tetratricopeptide (TPR) repeat protein